MDEFLDLVKQSLSILSTARIKDGEIELLINSAVKDMQRQGIYIANGSEVEDELIKTAIIMYVKANFGMTSINEKELAGRTYKDLCTNLSLSSNYKGL